MSISGTEGSQWIGGSAHYVEVTPANEFEARFIHLSTAPLRLELDLDFGIGEELFSVYELHRLEGKEPFPERKNDLYDAAFDKNILASEFKRLVTTLIGCGERFLSKDCSLWDELQIQRDLRDQKTENHKAYRIAEKAFNNKDWEKVISVLEGRKKSLSKLNLGRLNYAKKKAAKCT